MARQPTLAEILSDETGKIRPEVADLLMEANPQRLRPQPRPRPAPRAERHHIRWGWIVAGIILLWIFSVVSQCQNHPSSVFQNSQVEERPESKPIAPPMVPAVVEPKVGIVEPNPGVIEPKPAAVEPKQEPRIIKKGRVVADNVYLREHPGLQFPVIRIVNQGDTLDVVSFKDGWYEILLEGQKVGFVFGAFLLPLDFDSLPYRVGMTRNRSRVLVKEDDNSTYYQLIMANGQKGLIKKDDVSLFSP